MTTRQVGNGRRRHGDCIAGEQLAAAFQASGLAQQDFCECHDVGVSWVPVQSSTVFISAAYSACESVLYSRFRSGDLYCYFDFPAEQYHAFRAAD